MMENSELRTALKAKDEEIEELKRKLAEKQEKVLPVPRSGVGEELPTQNIQQLDNDEIARYSRQLILPELGIKGQVKLKNSRVLIVGCGGLGCPAAIYLAAAGIGCIGLVDYDEVELSNLHRQILHTEKKICCTKSASVADACQQLNSRTECVPYHLALTSENALQLIEKFDLVLDATDNVATRYLLNDACVLAKKPLVSGSALRFEGQLTVYNHNGGPCYRCLYPKPPPPETVTNCSDGGVVGVVPGIIGSLQALEAIKIASGMPSSFSQRLLLFDALSQSSFRTIKLRPRQNHCVVCGDDPSITKLIDYEEFCGAKATDKDAGVNILQNTQRISVQEYFEMLKSEADHVLIDVRQAVELDICQLPCPAINLPMDFLNKQDRLEKLLENVSKTQPVFVVCRRGNDSQVAVRELQKKFSEMQIKDIRGGLHAWAKHIDTKFPVY